SAEQRRGERQDEHGRARETVPGAALRRGDAREQVSVLAQEEPRLGRRRLPGRLAGGARGVLGDLRRGELRHVWTVDFAPKRVLMRDRVVIDRRFCGPPDAGHGGYTGGLLAERLGDPCVAVSFRAPAPLERGLAVTADAEGALELR